MMRWPGYLYVKQAGVVGVHWRLFGPYGYIGRRVVWVRLWDRGWGIHARWRPDPSRLLFSERNGLVRVYRWGPLWWKTLKGE